MAAMKELAIRLSEIPLVFLVQETKNRLEQQADINLVSSNELHALCNAIEIELINRAAVYQQYPEIAYE